MNRPRGSIERDLSAGLPGPFRRGSLAVLLIALLAMAGCAKHYVNEPLDKLDPDAGYRYLNQTQSGQSEALLVILAFSGGGTRAASLDYGVLRELARAEIVIDGIKRRLLDEIDVISSVSGGSFTASYFALFGDRIFEDFEEKFLKKNVQGKLTGKMFSPWVWPKLWSPKYNRDDMAAELYNKLLFEDKTFADLPQTQPPFIIINATDFVLGARWQFTQDQFDLICSDLSKFPIARAVAASSAVPGAFGTVRLRNQAETCGSKSPAWVADVLSDPRATFRMLDDANEAKSYSEPKRKFIHLVDGGITDNVGVRSILDMMLRQDVVQSHVLLERLKKTEKVVLLVVDAHVDKDPGFSLKEHIGFFKLLKGTVGVPMHRYSFESLELFQETLTRRADQIKKERAAQAEQTGGQPLPFDLYPIYLQFNHLPNKDDAAFFKTMPTSFRLKPEWVDRLTLMAADGLASAEYYKKLLKDLDAVVKPRPKPRAEEHKD